ncbi:MAG: cytochrome P450 [Pseudomonadota bacterium]
MSAQPQVASPIAAVLEDEFERQRRARDHAERVPLEDIDVTDWKLWASNTHWPYFERLRRDAPVYFHERSFVGPYWSLTRYADIKAVDSDHERFSSEPGITAFEPAEDFSFPSFIAMDPPKHDVQRRSVAPVVAPRNLGALEATIRGRVQRVLDGLPVGETFNWVDRVSIELTTQMLATLFDFPFEERSKLTFWSDVATGGPQTGVVDTRQQQFDALMDCRNTFTELYEARKKNPVGNDLLSLMARDPATRDQDPDEFLGNLLLLIVGGNDTTRNSMSAGVLAMNLFPDEYRKLRADRSLIPNMVAELIRWQTPLSHMRRRATCDVELGGQTIRAGDKVVMWYASGNRDAGVFEDPNRFLIDRANARSHLSFGFGLHRCMGNRLAELQLRILWEELERRFATIRVVGAPERTVSPFVHGYTALPVVLETF